MVAITVNYTGSLRCTSVHTPSGTQLITDAPADNGGLASSFSPTDLVATALLTCIMTTMAIYAERHQVPLTGMTGRAEKVMGGPPRKIAAIELVISMPLPKTHELAEKLMMVAQTCPVHHSLHPDTKMPIVWEWM